jgi:hypothetical protein
MLNFRSTLERWSLQFSSKLSSDENILDPDFESAYLIIKVKGKVVPGPN